MQLRIGEVFGVGKQEVGTSRAKERIHAGNRPVHVHGDGKRLGEHAVGQYQASHRDVVRPGERPLFRRRLDERHRREEVVVVELDPRGNVRANTLDYQTSRPNVFSAGDMRRGQSLVVWAIREGRLCARAIDQALMGTTTLPR